jgi:hypothetical protein
MRVLVAVILIVHGLIMLGTSLGIMNGTRSLQNPAWLKWWPGRLGESWLLRRLDLAKSSLPWLTGLVWWLGGFLLVLAGLGVFGIIVSADSWPAFAIVGAILTLAMLLVYLHPVYLLNILVSLVILVVLLFGLLSPASFT